MVPTWEQIYLNVERNTLLQFFMETINHKYINGENVLKKGFKLFRDMIVESFS
jgi:hypothetical protein